MAPSKEEMPNWANFPLTPCHLMKFSRYYYAIGNSPAVNIFYRNEFSAFEDVKLIEPRSWRHQSVDPAFEEALSESSKQPMRLRILCLACGDLRNALFSLAGHKESEQGSGADEIEFVVNDSDVHVLARNILLLDAIFDMYDDETVVAIFSIWFSTALHAEHSDYLRKRLRKLILEVDDPPRAPANWRWRCYEPHLLASLRNVWRKWLSFFRGTTETELRQHWTSTQHIRHKKFLSRFQQRFQEQSATEVEKSGSLEFRLRNFIENRCSGGLGNYEISCDSDIFTPEIKKNWREEEILHLLTGIFDPTSDWKSNLPWHVNPTLFWSEDSYDLHYGTNSISAFPFFAPMKGSKLVDQCFREFKTWLRGARENRENLSWTFSSSDVRIFCVNIQPRLMGWEVKAGRKEYGPKSVPYSESMGAEFQTGALVCVHGLHKSPHLNSCYGVLTREVSTNKRWGVRFFKRTGDVGERLASSPALPEKPVALKQSNLKLVDSNCGLLDRCRNFSCFDVVTSSNVADHIGMSTLLFLSRPLLVPGGTLLTTSFLHLDHYKSTKRYLEASLLGTDSSWWATLFGFRAMGYESKSVTSQACEVAHNEGNMADAFAPFFGSTRTNTAMVWLATARECNLPLASDGPMACTLGNLQQLTMKANSLHNIDGKVAALLCQFGAHGVLPSYKNYSERALLGRILTKYAGCTDASGRKGDSSSIDDEIALCSIQVEDATLRSVFCSALNPTTPTLYVQVQRQKIAGLWVEDTPDLGDDETRFLFFCWRDIMQESNWMADLCSVAQGGTHRLQIQVKEHWIEADKMQHVSSILVGGSPSVVKEENASRVSPCFKGNNAVVLDVPDLVSFHLFDESETNFMIRVSISTLLFGRRFLPSKKGFKIRQLDSKSYSLSVEVRVPFTTPDEKMHDFAFGRELIFSVPVTADGWEYEVGRGLLIVPKCVHNFFSTARRVAGRNRFCPLKLGGAHSGWSNATLQFVSAAQMTADERLMRQRKDVESANFKMPLLTEVKDSVISFLQLTDLLIYLMIKDQGVGVVGLVIRHGLVLDRQAFVPILDLSVCWLSSEIALELANGVMHMSPDCGNRHVKMWSEEYTLLQNLCNYSRASVDPALRAEHPDLRKLIKKKKLRAHFRRVLLRPLFPSAADQERSIQQAVSWGS